MSDSKIENAKRAFVGLINGEVSVKEAKKATKELRQERIELNKKVREMEKQLKVQGKKTAA